MGSGHLAGEGLFDDQAKDTSLHHPQHPNSCSTPSTPPAKNNPATNSPTQKHTHIRTHINPKIAANSDNRDKSRKGYWVVKKVTNKPDLA
jgi:hypothetical protein